MGLNITYNGYTFPIMPTFNPSMSIEYDSADNATVITEVWDMETAFVDDGAVALMGAFDTMEASLKADNGSLSLTRDGTPTPLREIAVADCVSGPRVTSYSVAEPRQGALVTNLQIKVTIEMKYPVTDNNGWLAQEINLTYSVSNDGLLSVSENSRYTSKNSIGLSSVPSARFNASTQSCVFTEEISYAFSDGNRTVSVSGSWQQIRRPLPSFAASGNYSISENYNQGIVEVSCSGSFLVKHSDKEKKKLINNPMYRPKLRTEPESIEDIIGDDYYTQELLNWVMTNFSADKIIEQSISFDPYGGNLGFNLKWYRAANEDSSVDLYTQSFSMNENFRNVNIVPTVDGLPVLQKTGYSGYSVSHAGTVEGVNHMPKKPEPIWPDNLISSPSYNYDMPSVTRNGDYVGYKISFSHSYWFARLEDMDISKDMSKAFDKGKDLHTGAR